MPLRDVSMPPPSQSSKVVIPESLRLQLADFRRLLWRVKILEAVAAGVIGLLVSFLLVYGMDRLWPTPGWIRLLVLMGGVSMFSIFAPYWLHRWVWQRRLESQLARLIAKRFPGLGDRLLGVIELQHQEDHPDSLSPRLREAAMEGVANEIGQRKLEQALPAQRHRRWSLVAIGLAVASAAAFTLTPRAGLNALQRWLMPFSNTERYTFVRLDHPPSFLAVAFGEAFDVTLRLSKESEQHPSTASGRFGAQPGVSVTLEQDTYHFNFPGQQDPGTIVFFVGDLRHEMKVVPMQRPSVESVRAVVSPPAYLGIPQRTVDMNAGVVSAVEGSKVRIEFGMNRAIASGHYGPTRGVNPSGEEGSDKYAPAEGELVIADRNAATPEFAVGNVPFDIPFAWVDQLGLSGEQGFRLRVDAIKDAPPTCYLQGVDRQKVMLPEETIDFEVLAEDDFGVKSTGIEWSGQFTKPSNESPAKGELELAQGGPEERRLLRPAAFSPAVLGITPQKITLRGYSEDFFPDRGRVYSEPIIIYVMSRDEHAQMLKNQYDRQITELEDLARREQGLLDDNQRLERLDGTELEKEENRKKLEEQAQKESETQRRMEDLTQRAEQLMKDAARNGEIDKNTLKKMAESLKSMQELSAQDVPKVQQKLQNAQEQSNTTEKSKKDVAQAVDEQQKVVDKMKDAIDKANDANRRFEAGTFVNRIKKAAGEENGILGSLKEGFNRMLGLKGSALDPTDVRRVNENSRQQGDTASDVRWIQEDLGHYFARTQQQSIKLIYDEMQESKIDSGLEDIRTALGLNHTYQAAELTKKWADKLNEWAKKLEGEKGSGGGGGGGGGPPQEDEDFEFMLRAMKLIQQEQDLRSRTRVLEQFRRDYEAPQTAKPTAEKP